MDEWSEHFEWTGAVLGARTAIGRVTIQVLAINDPDFLAVRAALIAEQAFPLE
jgi:aspartate-semialdehyde dehydrogenase